MRNLLTKLALKLNKYLLNQKIKQLPDEAPKTDIPVVTSQVSNTSGQCTCGCNHDEEEPIIVINVDLPNGNTLVLESTDICADYVDLMVQRMVEDGELPEGDYEDIQFEVFVYEGEEEE